MLTDTSSLTVQPCACLQSSINPMQSLSSITPLSLQQSTSTAIPTSSHSPMGTTAIGITSSHPARLPGSQRLTQHGAATCQATMTWQGTSLQALSPARQPCMKLLNHQTTLRTASICPLATAGIIMADHAAAQAELLMKASCPTVPVTRQPTAGKILSPDQQRPSGSPATPMLHGSHTPTALCILHQSHTAPPGLGLIMATYLGLRHTGSQLALTGHGSSQSTGPGMPLEPCSAAVMLCCCGRTPQTGPELGSMTPGTLPVALARR